MKKIFILLAITSAVYACNSGGDKKADEQKTAADTAATNKTADAASEKGLELIASNDCTTCHGIDNKITGPAYRDVANKYENTQANIDSLASKVIHGGSGVWGSIPMTPHPALSQDDAKEMVKYILSLKNK